MRSAFWLLFFPGVIHAADPAVAAPKAPPKAPPKAEAYLMLPEPRVMGSSISKPFANAQHTVFTPARRDADGKVRVKTPGEFAKLGLSWESFFERAQSAADRRLADLQPELKKDESGRALYAVYRSEEPSIACLLIAPSLGAIFKNILGEEVWLAAPDRNSLFVFPARREVIEEFAQDLRERFEENPFAVSDEIFAARDGVALRAVGSFNGPR